ncbi:hypothetical protein GQ53DRAFT_543818 [Thozetella sp. PMI_491]|nr:hypothetical protein GQ53DRAFT_543818 [Thozetella sp. PMI_491]
MPGNNSQSQGTQPPPDRGHPLPRRTTSDKSVTLRHHRLARDVTRVAAQAASAQAPTSSPRRNSSGESHETAHSDAKKWFDRSNLNPNASYDAGSMDVDPPFFQKETDSSNEETRPAPYPFVQSARQGLLRPAVTHSSSADDYRSVIDDLTIENKRLKEELKRYRQLGPDAMKKDKLFEIKVHGLPKRKKRELEATLRDFAASLEGSSEATSQRRKQGRPGKVGYYSGESMSKHASSSSSHSRPVDSAYASMSTGPSSNAPTSLGRPSSIARTKSSGDHKLENLIADTPDGLFPRHTVMTDKERKKLVVRRLEQLFTGKISGRNIHRNQSMPDIETPAAADPVLPALALESGASREAIIQPPDRSEKKRPSRDNLSASNSNGDQTESGGNQTGDGSGSGSGGRSRNNGSPPTAPPPEQRPTRPRDLDPDRIQIPSENMDYIRHLGLVPPEFLVDRRVSYHNVSPDADGWVYLNLLCNLAQLHMINVTPGFIRSAVTEKSAKFQLSPDGRKIRWRGGSDGTKFSSDSSGDNSQKSPSTEDTDGSNEDGQRKKQKRVLAPPSGESKFGPQASGSSGSFHYKPIFARQSSSVEASLEETGSQASWIEESNMDNTGNSKWGYSGSGSSQRRKRRRDGAIIYYSGAHFCTDLSRDPGDGEVSPTTYLTSNGQESDPLPNPTPAPFSRTLSGSSLAIRPLSDDRALVDAVMREREEKTPSLTTDDEDEDEDVDDIEFPWCDEPEAVVVQPISPPLEPCGLGGVLPEDHFAVVVTTRRTILGTKARRFRVRSEDTTDAIAGRLASMSTSSPVPPRAFAEMCVEIEYLSGRLKRFRPVPLPPPALFFPPFSTDSSSGSPGDGLASDMDDPSGETSVSQALISQRANPHQSDNTYPDDEELSSNDEEDEVDEDDGRYPAPPGNIPLHRGQQRPGVPHRVVSGSTGAIVETGSSAATAGGAESGYTSSMEEAAR